jgi:hypothetical protein
MVTTEIQAKPIQLILVLDMAMVEVVVHVEVTLYKALLRMVYQDTY